VSRRVIILGGGEGVWAELQQARTVLYGLPYDVAAVNDAGARYPGRLLFWATCHPEKLKKIWRHMRRDKPTGYAPIGGIGGGINHVVGHKKEGNKLILGSSGLYATYIALEHYGASHVVLCGVPMDARPNEFRGPENWCPKEVKRHRAGWLKAFSDPEFATRVRSMSGWTQEHLGSPSRAWAETR
jgi:hypothetical protein